MRIEGKVAVVTGAASGIGRALARRFKAEGAAGLALADLKEGPLAEVAAEVGGIAVPADVSRESDIANLVARAQAEIGPIDIFCSNAGIARMGDADAPTRTGRPTGTST